MQRYNISKKLTFNKIYIYICLLFLFYTSGAIYNYVYDEYNGMIKAIAIALFSFGIIHIKKNRLSYLLYCLICIIIIGIFCLIAGGSMEMYMKVAIRIVSVFIFFLYCSQNKYDILEILYSFIIVIAVFFLICWLLFDIGPFVSIGKRILINTYEQSGRTYNLYFTNYLNIYYRWHDIRSIFGLSFNSCNGPFSEPGLYQIWLNFALWYGLFIKKDSIKRITILVVAIVSTTSTMGAFILVGIIGIYVYSSGGKRAKLFSMIPLVLGVAIIFLYLWKERMSRIESMTSRIGEIPMLINGIIRHPIFGNGMGSIETTNGFLVYLFDMGLLGACFITLWLRKILISKVDISIRIVIILWGVLSLFNEPVCYNNLFLFMIFVLYFKIGNMSIDEIKNNKETNTSIRHHKNGLAGRIVIRF